MAGDGSGLLNRRTFTGLASSILALSAILYVYEYCDSTVHVRA